MNGIVVKDLVSGNNVCGKVVTVFQKRLEGDHHGVSEISELCVVFHFLCENVARIYDSRDVINVHIFRLIAFTNHILLDV